MLLHAKPKEPTSKRTIASTEEATAEKEISPQSPNANLSFNADATDAEESLKAEERKKKREAYYSKLDECHQIEEDLKRPERDNFRIKIVSMLSSDIGAWFYNQQTPPKDKGPVSQTDKLFRAVALSGLAKHSVYFNYKEDLTTALRLADEIINSDPTNSAGYLLKARLLDSQNKTAEAQKVLDIAEEKTDHFDTGMLEINRKMFGSTNGVAEMLLSFELQTPLLGVSSVLINSIVKYKKIKLGEQIMKPANDNSKLLEEIEWSGWDYQNAKYSLEKITGKKLPDHMEIGYKKNKILAQQFPEFDPEKESNKTRDKDDYSIECDNYAEMEKGLDLMKRAIARVK